MLEFLATTRRLGLTKIQEMSRRRDQLFFRLAKPVYFFYCCVFLSKVHVFMCHKCELTQSKLTIFTKSARWKIFGRLLCLKKFSSSYIADNMRALRVWSRGRRWRMESHQTGDGDGEQRNNPERRTRAACHRVLGGSPPPGENCECSAGPARKHCW